jgi:holo-[acyl-carrier protein] synthase
MAKALAAPHGARLRERLFTAGEIAYAESKANRAERYAARFAAKEAGMKALGTGWRSGLGWHDLEVLNLASGRPTLRLHGKAAEIAERLGARNISLSLTHTAREAIAFVIFES